MTAHKSRIVYRDKVLYASLASSLYLKQLAQPTSPRQFPLRSVIPWPTRVWHIETGETRSVRMEWQPEPKTRLAHIRHLEALAVIRSRKKVDAMRLELLNWLANRFGREVKAGHVIAFRFTYQTIAKVLGATRVTVAGVLNQFNQSGDHPISMFVARAREV